MPLRVFELARWRSDRKAEINPRVQLGSDKSRQGVPYNTNDGLSASLSITEFQQTAVAHELKSIHGSGCEPTQLFWLPSNFHHWTQTHLKKGTTVSTRENPSN
jgi:hypothetical protein